MGFFLLKCIPELIKIKILISFKIIIFVKIRMGVKKIYI